MKQITQTFVSELLIVDIQLINLAFSHSEKLGQSAISNSMYSFRELLVKDIGPFINSMNVEWRCYVLGLLNGVNDKYKDSAMMHIIHPRKD